MVYAAQAVVLAMRHGSSRAEDSFHARAGARQSFRLGEIGIEDFDACGHQRGALLMASSAAHERAYLAALTAEAEGNLLTDKTGGPNDKIHRYLHCGSLRGEAILANSTLCGMPKICGSAFLL